VGALLDKDFLFAQRVWFLRETPTIDGITASGDNIFVHHNEGKVYRIKPRTNLKVNKWWITDEVRYGWKFVHAENRLRSPMRKQFGVQVECDFTRAYDEIIGAAKKTARDGKRLALLVSPMLTCEEAFVLGQLARRLDQNALLAVGPVPVQGQDQVYPKGAKADSPKAFTVCSEKAPNARGVRRVLSALVDPSHVATYEAFLGMLRSGNVGAVILTGNYPSTWATDDFVKALAGKFVAVIDTLSSSLTELADVVIPGATWVEKAGTFENVKGMLQAFEQAIPVIELAKPEGQIALDMMAVLDGRAATEEVVSPVVVQSTLAQVASGAQVLKPLGRAFNAANVRQEMAAAAATLGVFVTEVSRPAADAARVSDIEVVDL
jgi:NADH-quinone oxidoreductase subunit G